MRSVEFDFRFRGLLVFDVNLCFGIVVPLIWSPSFTWLAASGPSALIFRMTGATASLSAHPSPPIASTNFSKTRTKLNYLTTQKSAPRKTAN